MSTAALALVNLHKRYGATTAVQDLSLDIGRGELVSLLGPSGCGKTTTLRMVAGLIMPSSGDIRIDGNRITTVSAQKRNIGMVFQNYALFPHLTVGENISFGLEMRGIRRRNTRKRVQDMLELVQLAAMRDRLPAQLSGGQQQRVALARALIIKPAVLLLDEPLGALDKNLREDMQLELRRLQRELGITTLMVTHDQEEALTLSDRVVVMRAGYLEQVGTPPQVYAHPATAFVAGFIGTSNILYGRLVNRTQDMAEVHTAGGALLAPLGDVMHEAVAVCVRPEAIRISPATEMAKPATHNCISAVVKQIIYRGSITQYHLVQTDGSLLIAAMAHGAPAIPQGASVWAQWDGTSSHILRPGGDA